MLFPFFIGPDSVGGAELLFAAGALPQVDYDCDFALFGVWGAVPCFDEVLLVDELATVLAFRVWLHTVSSELEVRGRLC